MTITVASDCSSVSLSSANLVGTNQSVFLTWVKNCATTSTKVSVNVASPVVQLDADDLGGTTTVPDGVYYFKLSITTQDGSSIEESLCRFINCESTCLMLPVAKLTDEESLIKQLAFQALLASTSCTSCACEDLCALYTATGLTTTTTNDECGCN